MPQLTLKTEITTVNKSRTIAILCDDPHLISVDKFVCKFYNILFLSKVMRCAFLFVYINQLVKINRRSGFKLFYNGRDVDITLCNSTEMRYTQPSGQGCLR